MLESLNQLLERTLKRAGLKEQASKWKVVHLWQEIVGESIAKISRPLKVIQGTLYVGTSSSSWASELDFRKNEILLLIKKHLGETGIREIRFQSTSWRTIENESNSTSAAKLDSSQLKKISALCEKIENSSLRKIFEKILTHDLLRKQ